jgi:hypothetical protein
MLSQLAIFSCASTFACVAATAQILPPVTLVQNQGPGSPSGYFDIVDMDAADLDNDGDIDLVFAAVGSNSISWLRNNGNGAYSLLQIPNTSGLQGVSAVHAADMDGDGDVDILFGAAGGYGGPVVPGSNSQLRIFRNNGQGSFTGTSIFYAGNFGSSSTGAKGVNHLTSADMDGDGDLDIVMCQGVSANFGVNWDRVTWIVNDGTSNFGATRTIDPGQAGDVPRRADTADVDGDGDIDLVVAYAGSDELVCWKNPGAGTGSWTFSLLRFNEFSWDAQFGDVDGDSDVDVVAAHAGGKVAYYLGDGAGGFAPQQVLGTAGSEAGPVALIDVDSDGDLDVFAGQRATFPGVTGDLSFFEAQGGGAFAPPQALESNTITRTIRSADLNGDGQRDLVIAADVAVRYYEVNFLSNAATKETFGTSCASAATSFYELLPQQSMDLTGKAVSGVRNGSSYNITVGPSTIEPLGPNAVLLDLGNDGYERMTRPVSQGGAGSLLPIGVSANGFITADSISGGQPAPSAQPPYQVGELLNITEGSFLTSPVPTLFAWTDLQPASGSSGGTFTTQVDVELGSLNTVNSNPPPQAIPTTDPLQSIYYGQGPTPKDVLYDTWGQFSTHGQLTLPHASGNALYVVKVRYQSTTGGLINFGEAGAGPSGTYKQMPLPASPNWQTETFDVWLPNVVNPAFIYAFSSAGPVRVNWIRISEPAPASGGVYFEDLGGGTARVTFDGVAGNGTAGANTVQFTLNLSGFGFLNMAIESFTIAFGALSPNNPEPWLVGFSPEGASQDTGSRDVSAGPFALGAEDILISLDSNSPRLGTNWNITASDYGPLPLGFLFFGNTKYDPGIPLAMLGAPGCYAYTSGNLTAQLLVMFGGAQTTSIPIANNPALIGVELTCQATATATANLFGMATSNGLSVMVGN